MNRIPSNYTEVLGNIVDMGINIFDFVYDIWTPTGESEELTKQAIQQKFIDMYYFREIGQETITMFKHYLKQRWQLLIPEYNKLFEAEYNTTLDKALTNDSFESNNFSVYNDTPKGVVDFDNKHATSFTKNITNNKGLHGQSLAEATRNYMQLVTNVTNQFLMEFNDLFFQLYGGVK